MVGAKTQWLLPNREVLTSIVTTDSCLRSTIPEGCFAALYTHLGFRWALNRICLVSVESVAAKCGG